MKIKPKVSYIKGKAPTVSQLDVQELAMNAADGKLYTKNTDNTVVRLAADADSVGGISASDLVTQTALTTALGDTVPAVPVTDKPFLDDSYKINPAYLPDALLGQLRYGGGFNGSGVITASALVPELEGLQISTVYGSSSYTGVFFLALAEYTVSATIFHTGDWLVCNGDHTPSFVKVDNSDAVMSVNGLLGTVTLYGSDIYMSNAAGAKTLKEAIESKADEMTSFTEAGSRANIATGDSVTTIWGKIKKYFSDLKIVAFTGSYADLTGTPTVYVDSVPPTSGMKTGDFFVKI
jgi:hypothetical protein